MWIFGAERTQGVCQLEQIIRVWPAGALGARNLLRDFLFGSRAEIGWIILPCDIGQAKHLAAIVEMQWQCQPQIAIAFTFVEMGKHGRRNQESDTIDRSTSLFDQRYHPSRLLRCAAMIDRGLPETARMAQQAGRALRQKRKIGAENQGTIAKQPDLLASIENSHVAVLLQRTGQHRRSFAQEKWLQGKALSYRAAII